MMNLLNLFRKQKTVAPLNINCQIELTSGYTDNHGGFLEGLLIGIENEEAFSISLKQTYFAGLYLFDPENRVKLIIRNDFEVLAVPVETICYERTDEGYSVTLGIQNAHHPKGKEYDRMLDWLQIQSA